MKDKVLITGSTARQYSSNVAKKSTSFAEILASAYRYREYDVDILEPSMHWTDEFLLQYRKILVGVAPALSLTSNCAYGSMSLISRLRNDNRLTLFIDAPEPWKIFANLRAITKNESVLFKSLYIKRKDYKNALDKKISSSIIDCAFFLEQSFWPITLFPALPWNSDPSVFPGVPQTASASMVPVFADSMIISREMNFNSSRIRRWVVENDSTKWTKNTIKTLAIPSISIKEQKIRTSADLHSAMNSSIGAIIGPHGDKMTWWSTAYSHAINACTPIATDWKVSGLIGSAWNHLASGIEEMSPIDQYELAVTQKIQYLESIQDKNDTISHIHTPVKA